MVVEHIISIKSNYILNNKDISTVLFNADLPLNIELT